MTRFGEILPIWHYSTSPSAIAKSFNSDLAKKFGSKRILIRNPGCRVAGAVFWFGSYARH